MRENPYTARIALDGIGRELNCNPLVKYKIHDQNCKSCPYRQTHTTASDARVLCGNHQGKVNIRLHPPNGDALVYAFATIVQHPNAERLFAGAWPAGYIAAVAITAKEMKLTLPADKAVDIDVDLSVVDLDSDVATAPARDANAVSPYRKATRGNVDAALNVIAA